MKYIVAELNILNGKLVLEPIYTPECSFGEPIYLRIITGNFKPKKITALFEDKSIGNRQVLREKIPTVFECPITEKQVLNITKETEMKFRIRLFVETNDRDYEILSDEIVKVLGMSLGPEHKTDLSLIYDQLNRIMDKLNV